MRRFIVGVMGPGEGADEIALSQAEELGRLVAQNGWVILSGGRDAGAMQAVNHGAKQVEGSLTIGVLPSRDTSPSPNLDIVIVTDMHQARNNINVLSSDVVVACGRGGPGTVAEMALALKANRPVILMGADALTNAFFQTLGGEWVSLVENPEQAIAVISTIYEKRNESRRRNFKTTTGSPT